MPSPEDENLKVFYRAMRTEELVTYRAALEGDAATAKRHAWRGTRAFAEHRRRLIAEVLQERGVEALN